jgi:hypothetical protein
LCSPDLGDHGVRHCDAQGEVLDQVQTVDTSEQDER